MKKIFSFLIFLVFIIMAFSQNTMISFAMQDKIMKVEMQNMQYMSGCLDSTENIVDCNHDCCYESEGISNISASNTTRENNKKIKIKINSFIDIFSFSLKSYDNKKLINITSPPNILRDIKNYSYTDLTKIIKSNT